MGERTTSHMRTHKSLWERIKDWGPRVSRGASPEGICLSRRHELDALVQAYSPLRMITSICQGPT